MAGGTRACMPRRTASKTEGLIRARMWTLNMEGCDRASGFVCVCRHRVWRLGIFSTEGITGRLPPPLCLPHTAASVVQQPPGSVCPRALPSSTPAQPCMHIDGNCGSQDAGLTSALHALYLPTWPQGAHIAHHIAHHIAPQPRQSALDSSPTPTCLQLNSRADNPRWAARVGHTHPPTCHVPSLQLGLARMRRHRFKRTIIVPPGMASCCGCGAGGE